MREIKFRGRRKNNVTKEYEWLYGLPVYNSDCSIIDKIEVPAKSGGRSILVNPETVGEYTGLKDKNGKEIYEGDKVAIYSAIGKHGIARTGVINYRRGSFYIGVKKYIDRLGVYFPEDRASKQPIEIIGNIHENKDLL